MWSSCNSFRWVARREVQVASGWCTQTSPWCMGWQRSCVGSSPVGDNLRTFATTSPCRKQLLHNGFAVGRHCCSVWWSSSTARWWQWCTMQQWAWGPIWRTGFSVCSSRHRWQHQCSPQWLPWHCIAATTAISKSRRHVCILRVFATTEQPESRSESATCAVPDGLWTARRCRKLFRRPVPHRKLLCFQRQAAKQRQRQRQRPWVLRALRAQLSVGLAFSPSHSILHNTSLWRHRQAVPELLERPQPRVRLAACRRSTTSARRTWPRRRSGFCTAVGRTSKTFRIRWTTSTTRTRRAICTICRRSTSACFRRRKMPSWRRTFRATGATSEFYLREEHYDNSIYLLVEPFFLEELFSFWAVSAWRCSLLFLLYGFFFEYDGSKFIYQWSVFVRSPYETWRSWKACSQARHSETSSGQQPTDLWAAQGRSRHLWTSCWSSTITSALSVWHCWDLCRRGQYNGCSSSTGFEGTSAGGCCAWNTTW